MVKAHSFFVDHECASTVRRKKWINGVKGFFSAKYPELEITEKKASGERGKQEGHSV